LAGYDGVNDAERLCLDPARWTVVGGRAKENTAGSASEMACFETETLSTEKTLKTSDEPLRPVDRLAPCQERSRVVKADRWGSLPPRDLHGLDQPVPKVIDFGLMGSDRSSGRREVRLGDLDGE
jgi:hypothetical protein